MFSRRAFQFLLAVSITFFSVLIAGGSWLVIAAESFQAQAQEKVVARIDTAAKTAKYSPTVQSHADRLKELRSELDANLERFSTKERETIEQEKALVALGERVFTLQEHLNQLSRLLRLSEQKVLVTAEQIAIRETNLEKVMEEKQEVAVEAELQKDVVLSYFSLLQTDANLLTDTDIANSLKIVLSGDSFTKNLREEMHLTALEIAARKIFHDLEGTMSQLEETDLLLSREHNALEHLHQQLERERKTLAEQRAAQKELIAQTQGEEKRFTALLAESRAQMDESASQILNLKADIADIEKKLHLLNTQRQPDARRLSKEKVQELLHSVAPDFAIGEEFLRAEHEEKPFSWPVPALKLTAQFHDEAYEDAFHVPHNAIDIRAAQGTEIHAPAAGYVYKTVDNGMGYSYIILIHKNNLMTVYGHVSGFNVEEGDVVQEGDIIGLTGATPGTKGAGLMTTGPHLHFEVWEDGVARNPLDYLPLSELPPEDIPAEYFLKALEEQKREENGRSESQ